MAVCVQFISFDSFCFRFENFLHPYSMSKKRFRIHIWTVINFRKVDISLKLRKIRVFLKP